MENQIPTPKEAIKRLERIKEQLTKAQANIEDGRYHTSLDDIFTAKLSLVQVTKDLQNLQEEGIN